MLYRWGNTAGDLVDAFSRGARISSNSYGGCGFSSTIQSTINAVTEQGMIVLAAAGNGNNGNSCPRTGPGPYNDYMYPASYDNVISVGGVTGAGCFTNTYRVNGPAFDPPQYHTNNDKVDILAQSFNVVSGIIDQNGGTPLATGTSVSCPQVAGIVALMLSVDPCLTHDDVLSILQSTGSEPDQDCPQTMWHPIYPSSGYTPKIVDAEQALLALGTTAPLSTIVSVSQTWGDRLISGVVEVNTGVILTVTGDLQFGTHGEVRVHHGGTLILDGAELSACDLNWKGIKVEGVSSSVNQSLAGKLVLQNNTVIRDALTAISMHPSYLGWPAYSQHWGGLIEASNSTIYNCNRAVEFMKYGVNFNIDRSTFNNCTFQNITGSAITIWENNGVTFEDCEFYDIESRGIYALNSAINVTGGCSFRSVTTGIQLASSYPNVFSSKIGTYGSDPNLFCVDQIGVDILGGSILNATEIVNNEFLGPGNYGVKIDNSTAYRIEANSFKRLTYACHLSSSGSQLVQRVRDNNFLQNDLAVYSTGNNLGLEIVDNCFTANEIYDVINVNSIVKPIQGSFNNAASNCYETIHSYPEFFQLFSNQVRYYLPLGGSHNVCLELDNYSGPYPSLILDRSATSHSAFNCPVIPDFPVESPCNIEVAEKKLFSTTPVSRYSAPKTNFNGGLIAGRLASFNASRDSYERLITPLSDFAQSQLTKNQAIDYIETTDFENDLQATRAAIGFAIYTDNVALANVLMDQLDVLDESDIEELQDLEFVVSNLSNPDLTDRVLDEGALSFYGELLPIQSRTYSTSLYEWATNTQLLRDYPSGYDDLADSGRQTSSTQHNEIHGVNIDGLLKSTASNEGLFSYAITDLVGRPLLSVKQANGLTRSDVGFLNKGVYIVVSTSLNCKECFPTSQVLVVQ
ncbi:MAG: right-handed parallel beta-helix repeat-containing protein [Saprospiraceae bacterium]